MSRRWNREVAPLRVVTSTTLDWSQGTVCLHLGCRHKVWRRISPNGHPRRVRCHECEPDALTPAIQRLMDDAERACMKPRFNGNNGLLIGWRRSDPRVQVYLSPEGGFYQAHRADTDLSVCTGLHTIKAVRRVLGLAP